MNEISVYIPRLSPALSHAAQALVAQGITTVPSATDADAILLPVPTPADLDLAPFRNDLVVGGVLPDHIPRKIDLLQDPIYVAQNAAITAEAALGMILPHLSEHFQDCPILILGWGRIGKALAKLLASIGVPVSIYARAPQDSAMLEALGYHRYLPQHLSMYRCVVNTAPAVILSARELSQLRPDCYLLELASGTFLPAERTESGRGLPGKKKPEASGRLIAQTVARHLKGAL